MKWYPYLSVERWLSSFFFCFLVLLNINCLVSVLFPWTTNWSFRLLLPCLMLSNLRLLLLIQSQMKNVLRLLLKPVRISQAKWRRSTPLYLKTLNLYLQDQKLLMSISWLLGCFFWTFQFFLPQKCLNFYFMLNITNLSPFLLACPLPPRCASGGLGPSSVLVLGGFTLWVTWTSSC